MKVQPKNNTSNNNNNNNKYSKFGLIPMVLACFIKEKMFENVYAVHNISQDEVIGGIAPTSNYSILDSSFYILRYISIAVTIIGAIILFLKRNTEDRKKYIVLTLVGFILSIVFTILIFITHIIAFNY